MLFCQKDDSTEEIRSYARFLCVATPEKADANGLINCLSHSLHPLGIEDVLNHFQFKESLFWLEGAQTVHQ